MSEPTPLTLLLCALCSSAIVTGLGSIFLWALNR